MPNNYQVSANQLTEGTLVLVNGKLGFARLTRPIEGKELEASDARKVQNNMSAVGKPHTTATVTQAKVLFKDAANPTVEERFVDERLYDSKKHPETGKNYSIDSKGTNLPVIAIPGEEQGTVVQDTSRQELAQGLDVTLVLRVYKPKNYANRGLSLDQVIVNEPVRYYSSGTSTDELASRGIVFAAPPQALSAEGASTQGESAPIESVEDEGTVIEDGLAFPAPAPSASAPAPQAAPAPQQAQPAEQAPAPQAAPAAQEETLEAKLARLEAENAQLKDAGSAVGAGGPWADGQAQAGITYEQG